MELFFSNTREIYYVREITRNTKEEINAVRRELDRMIKTGLLKNEERGNRLYYYLNKKYTYFPELLRMVAKTTGIGLKMRKLRRKLGDISYLMFSGEFVSGQAPKREQVDILVIGKLVLPELELLIKEQQLKMGREINYAVFENQEFEFRKTRRDPFIMDILYGTKVMVIGSEEDFCKREIPGL